MQTQVAKKYVNTERGRLLIMLLLRSLKKGVLQFQSLAESPCLNESSISAPNTRVALGALTLLLMP